jgi:hypothetical protein
VLLVETT